MIQIQNWEDIRQADQICDLVNRIYVDAEEGIWRSDKMRTDRDELLKKKSQGDVYLAMMSDQIIGTVCGIRESKNLYRFEMLSVDPKWREAGVGSLLVEKIEKRAADLGCGEIQFELLHPTKWVHSGKERMRSWYLKKGYQILRHAPVKDFYPQSIQYLITEADFSIWSKDI